MDCYTTHETLPVKNICTGIDSQLVLQEIQAWYISYIGLSQIIKEPKVYFSVYNYQVYLERDFFSANFPRILPVLLSNFIKLCI